MGYEEKNKEMYDLLQNCKRDIQKLNTDVLEMYSPVPPALHDLVATLLDNISKVNACRRKIAEWEANGELDIDEDYEEEDQLQGFAVVEEVRTHCDDGVKWGANNFHDIQIMEEVTRILEGRTPRLQVLELLEAIP